MGTAHGTAAAAPKLADKAPFIGVRLQIRIRNLVLGRDSDSGSRSRL